MSHRALLKFLHSALVLATYAASPNSSNQTAIALSPCIFGSSSLSSSTPGGCHVSTLLLVINAIFPQNMSNRLPSLVSYIKDMLPLAFLLLCGDQHLIYLLAKKYLHYSPQHRLSNPFIYLSIPSVLFIFQHYAPYIKIDNTLLL